MRFDEAREKRVTGAWRNLWRAAAIVPAMLCGCGTIAQADPPAAIKLELNKLETAGASCRAYLVFDNGGPALTSFKLDLVVFGKDGVIAGRLALEAGPLRAERTTVKLFDLADLACGSVGSILVNDLIACRDAAGDRPDCLDRLNTSSKSDVALRK